MNTLPITDDERQLLEARVAMARAIRTRRKQMNLSQNELAVRLKTSQPRIARIEQAAPEVSFDLIFRAYAVMGGRIALKELSANGTGKVAAKRKAKART